jgi:hypothetical protein
MEGVSGMAIPQGTLRVVVLTFLVLWMTPAHTQTPPKPTAPSDAEVRELEQRLDSLRQQIDQLEAAKDAATRQGLMQQNWRGMQDYMGWMHNRWGTGAPWMMGPDMMGPGWSDCPMMGGSGAAWPVPEGMSPEQYGQQMRATCGAYEQMSSSQTTAQRQRLLQEHWQTMYRDMENMRGMGWMWHGPMMSPGMMGRGMMGRPPAPGAGEAKPLPDADSAGAKLVSSYCVQCHAAPSPTLHTEQEWASVIGRMNLHMNGGAAGIRTPSNEEF